MEDVDKFNKETEKDLSELKYICRKTLQFYRIRLMCLNKRHVLLGSVQNDFDSILNNPNFYSILDTNIKRERKLLKIARKTEKHKEGNLKYALKRLKHHKEAIKNKNFRIPFDDSGEKVSVSNLLSFLKSVINLLHLMEEDLSRIESRLKKEEKFLEKKDADNFNKFILAWDDEMKANTKLIKHFTKVMRSNDGVIKTGEDQGLQLLAGGISTVALAGAGHMVARYAASGSPLQSATLVYLITFSALFVGFLVHFNAISKKELVGVTQDREILKKIEETRAIKKPLLKRIFGF